MTAGDRDDRAAALETIRDLARRHGLTTDEVLHAVGDAPAAGPDGRGSRILVRVLGVLGGIFVFAGIGTFIALQWEDLSSAARVVVTLGAGVSAFAIAIALRRDARFDAAVTALFAIAAILEPTGMLVAFSEYGHGGDWRWASLFTCGTMTAQFVLAFVPMRRSALLFIAVAFGAFFWGTALDLAGAEGSTIALVLGASLVLLALRVDRTPHRDVTALWHFAGAAMFLYGLFDLVEGSALEIVFLPAAIGVVYLSAVARSRALLVVSTLAILAYTSWFTSEHFADSIGWPLALVGLGGLMIGLSALAVRIDRRYVTRRAG